MRALLAALLCSTTAWATALSLEGSTDSLEIVTSAAGSIDYQISWSNVTATALTTPGTSKGNITTAATTSVLAAPSASNWRHIRGIKLFNAHATVANTVTIQVNVSASLRRLYRTTLAAGETLSMDEGGEWQAYMANGARKLAQDAPGYSGRRYNFTKLGTVPDAIGYHYAYGKDTGFPGAYTLQSPGLTGFNTDCSIASQATNPNGAAQMGAHVLPNPTSGAWHMTRFGLQANVANTFSLIDVVWYNTGLAVTTTTGQTINSIAFPARDINGSSNGDGYQIALLTTGANTNAAAIANSTVTYTNNLGTSGRTATLSATIGYQTPATAVLGTFIPFMLAAGDTGVQSIQTVTLGTSYGAGALSVIVYREIAMEGVPVANLPSGTLSGGASNLVPGVRVYNGTCFWLTLSGATTAGAASIFSGALQLMER